MADGLPVDAADGVGGADGGDGGLCGRLDRTLGEVLEEAGHCVVTLSVPVRRGRGRCVGDLHGERPDRLRDRSSPSLDSRRATKNARGVLAPSR